jgi:GT2 family glycosyltransferase
VTAHLNAVYTMKSQTRMAEEYPKVSVIVTNARDREYLGRCLKTLVETDYPDFEIIVVDCQTPRIKEWIAESFQDVKLVHFEEDIGPSASHNVGVAKADPSSRYLAFLDNDTTVERSWLKELIKVVHNDQKIGIAQAKILKMGRENRLDHTGLAIDTLGTWYTALNMKEEHLNRVLEIFAASLAACIVTRDVFDGVGGFDEDYFIYDDDTDFCWRARLLGYRVIFVPSARVCHSGQVTKGLQPRKLFHSVKNRVYTLLKNYELRNLWWRMCVYYVIMSLSVSALVFLLKPEQALASLKGLADIIMNFKDVWQKRMEVQSRRRVSDEKLFEQRLLRKDVSATLSFLRNEVPFAIFRRRTPLPGG